MERIAYFKLQDRKDVTEMYKSEEYQEELKKLVTDQKYTLAMQKVEEELLRHPEENKARAQLFSMGRERDQNGVKQLYDEN